MAFSFTKKFDRRRRVGGSFLDPPPSAFAHAPERHSCQLPRGAAIWLLGAKRLEKEDDGDDDTHVYEQSAPRKRDWKNEGASLHREAGVLKRVLKGRPPTELSRYLEAEVGDNAKKQLEQLKLANQRMIQVQHKARKPEQPKPIVSRSPTQLQSTIIQLNRKLKRKEAGLQTKAASEYQSLVDENGVGGGGTSAIKIETLANLGFSRHHAKSALNQCGESLDEATALLMDTLAFPDPSDNVEQAEAEGSAISNRLEQLQNPGFRDVDINLAFETPRERRSRKAQAVVSLRRWEEEYAKEQAEEHTELVDALGSLRQAMRKFQVSDAEFKVLKAKARCTRQTRPFFPLPNSPTCLPFFVCWLTPPPPCVLPAHLYAGRRRRGEA
jgi:hypothetical protein